MSNSYSLLVVFFCMSNGAMMWLFWCHGKLLFYKLKPNAITRLRERPYFRKLEDNSHNTCNTRSWLTLTILQTVNCITLVWSSCFCWFLWISTHRKQSSYYPNMLKTCQNMLEFPNPTRIRIFWLEAKIGWS